jgi:hemolysin D
MGGQNMPTRPSRSSLRTERSASEYIKHTRSVEFQSVDLDTVDKIEVLSSEAVKVRGGATLEDNALEGNALERTQGGDSSAWSAWSQSLQSVLDQPAAALPSRMIWAGLLFCGAFAAWTWFGQVQEVSHASGQLMPQGKVYKVQAVAPGEIVRLLVKPGQHVKTGQLMAELDNRLAETEVNRLQQSLGMYRLQLIQSQELLARTALESQFRHTIAAAQINVQEAALTKAKAEATTQAEMLTQVEADLEASNKRLERLKPLLTEGIIAQEQVFDVEQSLRDRQRGLTQNQGGLASALAEAKRLQAELTRQQAEAKRSAIETQQRLQQLKLDTTTLETKISETENLLEAAQTQLQSTYVYAPVNGIVSTLSVDNVGEVAQLGSTIAEIAPDNMPLVLSALLPNQEAGLVKTGMPVQIKFDAFPYQEYGIVSGKIASISPDAERDERLGAVYKVDISLDRSTMMRQNQTMALKAGQTASADIIIRQRRILDVLLKPFKTLQKDSLKL